MLQVTHIITDSDHWNVWHSPQTPTKQVQKHYVSLFDAHDGVRAIPTLMAVCKNTVKCAKIYTLCPTVVSIALYLRCGKSDRSAPMQPPAKTNAKHDMCVLDAQDVVCGIPRLTAACENTVKCVGHGHRW